MEDLTNIWNTDDELNEEQLMNYANNKLTDEESHKVESKMNNSAFENDAVEGLKNFSSTEKMNNYVQQINANLHTRLSEKKHKNKKGITNLSWQIIAVIMIIILCVLGYVIIEMMKK